MNISCIICSDLFAPSSEVYSTKCGHIFHYICLITWLERAKSCPQCRQKTSDKSIFRIYFNILNGENVKEDAVSLQSKVDSLTLNLRMKEADLKSLNDKFNKAQQENNSLIDKIAAAESEMSKHASRMNAVKEQLLYAKAKQSEFEKVENELKAMKQKVTNLEQLTKGITGSYEECLEVARDCQDHRTITNVMVSLKKEVQLLKTKKEKLFLQLKKVERESKCYRNELEVFRRTNEALRSENTAHENCESDKQVLRRKIEELIEKCSKGSKEDSSLRRILDESPLPQLPKAKNAIFNRTLEVVNSPDLMNRAKAIKESDSPYLQVKQYGLGMLLHSQGLTSRFGNASTSIFKEKRLEAEAKPKNVPANLARDGMGGYERTDLFQTSSAAAAGQNLKRQKPSSSLPSSKFRKLAKIQSNKINNYLDISQSD